MTEMASLHCHPKKKTSAFSRWPRIISSGHPSWPAGSECPCQTSAAPSGGRQGGCWTRHWVTQCRGSPSPCRCQSSLAPTGHTERERMLMMKFIIVSLQLAILWLHMGSRRSPRRSSTAAWAGCKSARSWRGTAWMWARGGRRTSPWMTRWSLKTNVYTVVNPQSCILSKLDRAMVSAFFYLWSDLLHCLCHSLPNCNTLQGHFDICWNDLCYFHTGRTPNVELQK